MVEELARCGVRRAAVSPGSRSTPLALALWRQPAIEVEVVLDERSAGFFALGTALATGVPGRVLCTSGSAAANFHPAVVEADEAVGAADRAHRRPAARAARHRRRPDDRPAKLYGDAVRWFCEVGTHEADDDGLLHFRSVACRAYATAVGDPRPGPVHLNVPWREPLAPIPVEGDVTATDPLALEGRGERPLSAVARAPAAPDDALLDELAERIASAPRGLIVAGRQPDPRPGRAGRRARRGRRLPRPGRADLAASLGPARPLTGRPALRPDRPRRGPTSWSPSWSSGSATCRPARPCASGWRRSRGCGQIVVDPAGDWKEPTRRAETLLRADPRAGG